MTNTGKHAAAETWEERADRLIYELKNPRRRSGAHLGQRPRHGLDKK